MFTNGHLQKTVISATYINNKVVTRGKKSNPSPVLIVKRCLNSLLGPLFAFDLIIRPNKVIASQLICACVMDLIILATRSRYSLQ